MSQDSISSELERELLESQTTHQELLYYSREATTLIIPEEMEQAQTSEFWTYEEKNTLQENRRYFEKMIEVVGKAEREGPQKLPKQPKKSLLHLFKEKEGKKKSRKEMTDIELHNYLVANRADVETAISREAFSENHLFSEIYDENEIVRRLQKSVKNVKKQDAQTMMFYIQFGIFLNLCKDWFDEKRKSGIIVQTWAQWLKEKCDYSEDHARKLVLSQRYFKDINSFSLWGFP